MELDEMLKRAYHASLTREKIFLTYPVLLLASLIIVFTFAILHQAHDWIIFGAICVPIYLTFGLLGSLAVFIHRIYYHELRGETVNYKDILKASFNRMLNGVFLALPLILAHVGLWLLMGLFYLIQGIPYFGPVFAVVFAMLPFAFMMAMGLIPLIALIVLFYGSSFFAFDLSFDLSHFKERPSLVMGHFVIAILPLLLGTFFLGLIYWLTMNLFGVENNVVAISLQRLFLLLPFSFYLTPFVLFFFHFGLESYRSFIKKG
ncbi:MAG: hypothetical protein EB053_00940 [Chlamydiae bacterium]|nr:hypothetical protein [Chlamydiota bacterium]